MQIYVSFILLSRTIYIFPDFSGWNNVCLNIFCIIKTYCGVVYPPKIFFIKFKESRISSLIVRIFVEVGLIVKDSVIICETIKWVFGTALLGGDFYLLKTILGP